MKEILLLQGNKFNIFAIVFDDETCPACNFLDGIEKNDKASYKTILNLIKWHAESGPIRNKRKSRIIEGNLFEFKTAQGDRLLYFYCSGKKTVVTDGFHKGADKENQIEYKKSKRLRERYFKEVDNG
jgi:hypothetical protein